MIKALCMSVRRVRRQVVYRSIVTSSTLWQTNEYSAQYDCLMNELRVLGFSTEDSQSILASDQRLINTAGGNVLKACYENLRCIMPKASAETLMIRQPSIALRSVESIEKIHEYLTNDMGIDYKEFLHSSVFSHDFEHLKARHLFLLRAGFYEMPGHDGQTKNIRNMTLRKIVDTDDATFTKLVDMPAEDYRTFRNIVQLEAEMAEQDGEDIDDESVDEVRFKDSEIEEQMSPRRPDVQIHTYQKQKAKKRNR